MSTQPLLQRTAQKRIALPVRVEPKVSKETTTGRSGLVDRFQLQSFESSYLYLGTSILYVDGMTLTMPFPSGFLRKREVHHLCHFILVQSHQNSTEHSYHGCTLQWFSAD